MDIVMRGLHIGMLIVLVGISLTIAMKSQSESDLQESTAPVATDSLLCTAAYPNTLTWLRVNGLSIYTDTRAECLTNVMANCPTTSYFVYSEEKTNNCPAHCANGWQNDCGDCAGCGCVSASSLSTTCPSSASGNWQQNCGSNTDWACHRMGHTHTYSIQAPATTTTTTAATVPLATDSLLCTAAYPNTLTWLQVNGLSIYTDTRAECLSQVMASCPTKSYFVYSEEKTNNCPAHCANGWQNDCGDCAGCGCVSATALSTTCPSSASGNWQQNCGSSTDWACHRMGHTHTYSIQVTPTTVTTTAPPSQPSAVGDPHLTNLHGEKFDIHDGLHRLVHYPRGVPEEKALLVVDAQAVDMGKDSDCYSVYLQRVKMSGRWVGEEISIDASSSEAGSSADAFGMSFASKRIDWPTLAKQQDFPLKLNGSMPVTVSTSWHNASGEDAMGGEEMTFKVGDQLPVFVHVWSSHGKNFLTHDKDIRYLNLEVRNLPKNSGGIIGLDSYSRPSTSQCDLIQEERNLMDYAENVDDTVSLLRRSRPRWTASVTVQQQ